MSSLNVIKDDSGATFIPSSQRPDGTWRKPIRVRDGYVPQEEQPLYVSKGKQPGSTSSGYPIGLSDSDVQSYSTSSKNASGGLSFGYFEVGNYKPAVAIPGLNFVNNAESEKPKTKVKKAKKKGSSESEDVKPTIASQKPADVQLQTDPVKRLRNLRKRLKDIEALEHRIDSGDLKTPEKEQLEKIKRKDDVLEEIDDLEKMIEDLELS